MSENLVRTLKVDGRNIAIHVNDSGKFWAKPEVLGHEMISADTLAGLELKLRKKIRRVDQRAEIPVTLVWEDSWRDKPLEFKDTVLVGIHGGHGHPIFKPSPDGWRSDFEVYRRLSESEQRIMAQTHDGMRTAIRAFKAMKDEWSLHPEKALQAELDKLDAAAAPARAPAASEG